MPNGTIKMIRERFNNDDDGHILYMQYMARVKGIASTSGLISRVCQLATTTSLDELD